MPAFRLSHRHTDRECAVAYAAWKGFESPLRGGRPFSSCPWGGQEIWWDLDADTADEALECLPPFLAERSFAVRVSAVDIP